MLSLCCAGLSGDAEASLEACALYQRATLGPLHCAPSARGGGHERKEDYDGGRLLEGPSHFLGFQPEETV